MKRISGHFRKVFSQEFIDRIISGGLRGQLTLLVAVIAGVLVIASLVVTFLGVGLSEDGGWGEQMWVLYNNFVDPGSQISQEKWGNRLVVGIISLLGSILLGGVLISTISNIIERRVETVRTGKAYYKSIRDHYAIIGCGDIIVSLIKELHKADPDAPILVMSSQESEKVRHTLQANLDRDEERHVYIYFGNIESAEELGRMNIDRAKEVYILGEEGDYGRDSKNIQCVRSVGRLKGKAAAGHELPVYTLSERIASYNIIQKIVLSDAGRTEMQGIYFRPFNLYENWARRLWSYYAAAEDEGGRYDPLDYDPIRFSPDGGISGQDRYVHLVIAGFGAMGQALLLEAMRVCHYANYDDTRESGERVRTVITVIDRDMEPLKQHFMALFPYLGTAVDDIQVVYRNGDLCSPRVRESLVQWAADPRQMLTVAVCISDPDESIILGLNLPGEIYRSETRVLIRQEMQTDMGRIIHNDKGRYRNVKVFGMLEQGIAKSMLLDEIPSYVNQEYVRKGFIRELYGCMKSGDAAGFAERKAEAAMTWMKMEENMRWANRYQVDAYVKYLNTLGYGIVRSLPEAAEEIGPEDFIGDLDTDRLSVLMRMEKHRWNAERTIEGWKYGEVRDDVHRIHPLIVPYCELAENERFKDRQVIVNLPYLMAIAGFAIVTLTGGRSPVRRDLPTKNE